jgi:hypothetical protein
VMLDPLAAMRSACMAIADGEANEIEMEWSEENDVGRESRLIITVRREVRNIVLQGDDTEGGRD